MSNNLYKDILITVDKDIRPYLRSHGGEIEVKSFEEGTLTVSLFGNCKNCLSAQYTFEDLIKKILEEKYPEEINEVVLYNDIDEDLWKFAKSILNKDK